MQNKKQNERQKETFKINKNSIAINALKPMSVRLTLVVLCSSLIGYLHISRQLQNENIKALRQYIDERGQREQLVFQEASQNQEIFSNEFKRLYASFPDSEIERSFARIAVREADGTYRSLRQGFDGTRMPGVFLGKNTVLTRDLKRRVVVSFQIISHFGPAWRSRFQDTYVTFPENGLILFWPEAPNWVFDAKPDFDMTKEEYVYTADRLHNPERKSVFTGLFLDDVGQKWMSSCLTPIDSPSGRHLATISHDVMVEETIERSLNDKLPGTSNFIFRRDGRMIAHPDHMKMIQKNGGNVFVSDLGDGEMEKVLLEAKKMNPPFTDTILELDEAFYGVTRIEGPQWYFVTKYPKSMIVVIARNSALFLVLIGFLSLAFEISIVFSLLKLKIAKPLGAFVSAINEFSHGELQTKLDSERKDELGDLARAFTRMSEAIGERDLQLESHNRNLERTVKERTYELMRQKEVSIQVGKMAALGQMAGGIAHEINTPLGALLLNLESLRRKTHAPQEVLTTVEKCLQIINKVAVIIQSLRNLSRDGSQDEMQVQPVRKMIEETLTLCSKKLHVISVDFRLDLVDEELMLACQPTEISQVLLNLINNAYDAVEVASKKWIRLDVRRAGDFCEIRIADSGPGIPPEIVDRIFQPFFTTKGVGKGTGIGLSLSFGIIKKHQGEIFLDPDSPDTTFVVRLPLAQEVNPLLRKV